MAPAPADGSTLVANSKLCMLHASKFATMRGFGFGFGFGFGLWLSDLGGWKHWRCHLHVELARTHTFVVAQP